MRSAAGAPLALAVLLCIAFIGLAAAPKSKWKESDDPNKVTHWSGRHHTYSIHEAAKKGHTEEVLRHLKNDRGDVHKQDYDGQTAMHYAALYDQTHLIEVLHEAGANIEATNNHEMTPLHYTARSNHVEGLKILVDKGANVHHKDKFNATVRKFCHCILQTLWCLVARYAVP